MSNFKMEQLFQVEATDNRYYKLQKDYLKKRKYVYASFPSVNKNSVELSDLRNIVYADAYCRYLNYQGDSVLHTVGINNTNEKLYENVSSSVLSKDDPYTNIKIKSYKDLYSMDIGYDNNRRVESHSKEFIYFIQEAFVKLYKFNHIVKEEDDFYLDFSSIKDNVLSEIIKDKMFEPLKKILDYQSGIILNFKTTTEDSLTISLENPEFISGINFIALKPSIKNKNFYLESEKEYINSNIKNKKSMGVFSGNFAINPLTKEEIPIIISPFFKEEIHVGIGGVFERDLFFSSYFGLEYKEVLNKQKTLQNSLFLDDLSCEEAKNKIMNYFIDMGIAESFESVNNTKLLISNSFHDGISIPFYEQDIVNKKELPILIDSKNNVRTVNYKLPNKKTTDKVFNYEITQAFLSIASRLKNEGGIIDYSSNQFILEIKDFPKFELAIFHSDVDYLYTLVLNMILLNSIREDITNIFSKVFIENVVENTNTLIEINAIVAKYGACSLRFDMLNIPLNQNYFYNIDYILVHHNTIEQFKQIYSFEFLKDYQDLDTEYNNLVKNCTESISRCDTNRYINLIKTFILKVSEHKKISSRQAKGLLVLFSIVAPSVCEFIYKEHFNKNYPLMFESWPW